MVSQSQHIRLYNPAGAVISPHCGVYVQINVQISWCQRSISISVIMHEEQSVFRVFGPEGTSASKCIQVLLTSVDVYCRNSAKLYFRLIRWKLLSLGCFLPIEDIGFPRAICLSTLPYQETINTTICGLVTSPVIPPNQIMTNWKKQGE